jgi:predicted N-acetyltransferase YhbS
MDIMMQTLPTVDELYRVMGRMVVRFYGRTPGSSRVVASHAVFACTGLGSVHLNCGVVFGDGARGEDPAEDRLREFVARIRERGVGGHVCLSGRIERRLEPLARELGLEPLPPVTLMARAADEPAGGRAEKTAGDGTRPAGAVDKPRLDPAAFTCEPVADAAGLSEVLAVSEAAFGLPAEVHGRVVRPALLEDPAVTVYVCRLERVAVACVCVVDDDGLAGMSGMATLPGLQRRGIGGVLLAHVLAAHRERARAFCLTAGEAGRPLYRRAGFTTVDAATAWVVPPPGS